MPPELAEAIQTCARADEAGRLHHVIRVAIRDLVRIDGFDRARSDVAHIINSEADRAGRYEHVAERG